MGITAPAPAPSSAAFRTAFAGGGLFPIAETVLGANAASIDITGIRTDETGV